MAPRRKTTGEVEDTTPVESTKKRTTKKVEEDPTGTSKTTKKTTRAKKNENGEPSTTKKRSTKKVEATYGETVSVPLDLDDSDEEFFARIRKNNPELATAATRLISGLPLYDSEPFEDDRQFLAAAAEIEERNEQNPLDFTHLAKYNGKWPTDDKVVSDHQAYRRANMHLPPLEPLPEDPSEFDQVRYKRDKTLRDMNLAKANLDTAQRRLEIARDAHKTLEEEYQELSTQFDSFDPVAIEAAKKKAKVDQLRKLAKQMDVDVKDLTA